MFFLYTQLDLSDPPHIVRKKAKKAKASEEQADPSRHSTAPHPTPSAPVPSFSSEPLFLPEVPRQVSYRFFT